MAKKKGWRIKVAMLCSVCNKTNSHTSLNKSILPKLEQNRYCSQCKKHTVHNSREKLK